jgi:cytochrome P450 family 135
MPQPPGPSSPALIQTLMMIRDPLRYFERCMRRYGRVFTVKFLAMGDLVYVVDPALVKQIFTGDSAVFRAGEANEVLEPVLGRGSVLLLDGEQHMRERRLLLPPFHGESVRRYGELMEEVARAEVAGWTRGSPVAVRPRMQAVTLEVILRAVFGIRETDRLARLGTLIPRLLEAGNVVIWLPWLRRDLGPWSPWRRFARVRDEVDEILLDEIRRRRALPDLEQREDVLSLLLSARYDDGSEMAPAQVRDELVTLLVAGHETTATGLAWALERLAHNPAVQERLADEVAAGDDSYIEAVIKETLRVRPVVVDVARMLAEPIELGGYEVPAGRYVVAAIAAVHLLSGAYDDAEEFRPERFLDGQPEPYSWIPFGGGVRRCIGAAFASFEMKVVLRTVVEQLRLRPAEAQPERPKLHHVTLVPSKGARLVVEDRASAPSARVRTPAYAS